MNKKLLWDSILQQAISGKLVPQLDTEPAVEQIGPDPAPDEVPFELPEKWKWVNLDRTGSFSSGYTPSQEQILGQGDIPFFKVAQMNLKGNEKYLRLTPTFLNTPRKIFEAGTIVFPKLGGAILTNKRRILAQKSVVDTNTAGFLPTKDVLSLEYAYAFLSTLDFGQYARGTAVPALDLSKVKKIWLPLPPLAEQRRIVAKLEELKPLVDQFGEAHDKLSELEADFPRKLKASILQAAMQGKLVPQQDTEPAVEQLGPAPSPDEVPFALPEKWKWVKAGQLGFWKAGGTPSRSNPAFWNEGTINWIKTGELNDGIINCVEEKISQEGFNNSSTHLNPVGAVLIAMYGATIGRLGVLAVPSTTNQACCACTVNKDLVDNWFLFFVLMGLRPLLIKQGAGSAQPNISKDKLVNQWVPLPPLEEQRRIVERIEQLFAEVDKMSACKAP